MKITNKFNLPEPLVKAITAGEYKRGEYSASMLPSPPQIRALEQRYWDEIVIDVSDRIWILLGRAVHYILEKAEMSDMLQEEKLKIEVMGQKILAHPDLLSLTAIDDYKITGAYTMVFSPEGKKEWIAQENIYRYIAYEYGFNKINKLNIITIFRDWKKNLALANKEYPQHQVGKISAPVWTIEDTLKYIKERLTLHMQAESLPDNKLPECSFEERWEKITKYAVKKEGRKSAVRVFETKEQAEKLIEEKGDKHSLEIRPGERTRCEHFCNINKRCCQYQQYKKGV